MTIDAAPVVNGPPITTPDGCKLPPPSFRRALRELAGRTQEDVAAEVGVSGATVSLWERRAPGPGRRNRSRYLLTLIKYAAEVRAMGLHVEWPHATSQQK